MSWPHIQHANMRYIHATSQIMDHIDEVWKFFKEAYRFVESGRLRELYVKEWLLHKGFTTIPVLPQFFLLLENGTICLLLAIFVEEIPSPGTREESAKFYEVPFQQFKVGSHSRAHLWTAHHAFSALEKLSPSLTFVSPTQPPPPSSIQIYPAYLYRYKYLINCIWPKCSNFWNSTSNSGWVGRQSSSSYLLAQLKKAQISFSPVGAETWAAADPAHRSLDANTYRPFTTDNHSRYV